MPEATPQQKFISEVRNFNQKKAKHLEYYKIYERLRKQRAYVIKQLRDADAKKTEQLKEDLHKITTHMEEARNRSINILKNITTLCENIEQYEILHGLDRNSIKAT